MPQTVTTDILIIGAGPIGLYGAFCAGFRGLSTTIVDALPQCGGQITALYPEKQIRDIAAIPGALGRDVISALKEQADTYNPTYLLGRQATELTHDAQGRPNITLSDGTTINAGAVILTAGIGTFTPRTLPAGEEFLDRGLSYFVPDPTTYTDSDVLIVGGGDSAIDWTLALQPIARSVTLIHRRNTFRAHAANVHEVRASTTTIITNAEVEHLTGDHTLREAHIRNHTTGTTTTIKTDAVIAALGFISNLGPLTNWGLELNRRTITVDTHMHTNLNHIYAAGDITTYPGKVRLISVGFGEVATAINNAATTINPELPLFPGHSTDQN